MHVYFVSSDVIGFVSVILRSYRLDKLKFWDCDFLAQALQGEKRCCKLNNNILTILISPIQISYAEDVMVIHAVKLYMYM